MMQAVCLKIWIAAFCFFSSGAKADDAATLWKAIAESRFAISSGEIQVMVRPQVVDFKEVRSDLISKYYFWWKENACRVDRQEDPSDDSSGIRNFRQVMNGKIVLDCWDCDDVVSLATEDLAASKSVMLCFRPIALGCTATNFGLLSDPKRVLERSYAFAGLSPLVVRDVSGTILTAKDNNLGVEVTIALSPDVGELPKRMFIRRGNYESETIAEWKEYASKTGTAVFFPSRIEDRVSVSGKLQSHTIYDVKVIQLMDEISDEIFTWRGLGIPSGKNVMVRTENEPRYISWNGKKFSDALIPAHSLDAPRLVSRTGVGRTVMLLLTAGVVLILLFLVIRKRANA